MAGVRRGRWEGFRARDAWYSHMEFHAMKPHANPHAMRRTFINGLAFGLRVVWPVLSILIGTIAVLGLVVGRIEGWSVQESLYFAFVSGLTIGYGDFAPGSLAGRALAIVIGICGVLLTALVAAIAVRAINAVRAARDDRDDV